MGLAERLHSKGWTKPEIDHALDRIKTHTDKKTFEHRVFEEGIYWLSMVILVVANISISWFLFPFLSQIPHVLSTSIAAMLGVVWGVLFGHLGHEIARLEPQKHTIMLFTASITVAFTAIMVGSYSIVLSVVFSGVFVIYYSYMWWRSEH